MSKAVKIAQPGDQATFSKKASDSSLDWGNCVLCQVPTNEPLQCPATARNTRNTYEKSYKSLEVDIKKYHELNNTSLPKNIGILDDDEGITSAFCKNNAKWHKLCRNKFSNWKLQRTEQRTKRVDDFQNPTPAKLTRLSSGSAARTDQSKCFFCGDDGGQLHQVSTFEMDKKVRQYAIDLQDTLLLAKLSAGDLISQEAVYHLRCYRDLFHQVRDESIDCSPDNHDHKQIHGIVLAELVSYIEDSHTDADIIPVFKLSDLVKLYKTRLEQLGVASNSYVHASKLKERILAIIPELQAHKQGRDILLVYSNDIGEALRRSTEHDYDDEAMILARAANIVRKDLFEHKQDVFSCSFDVDCQEKSVPQSLKALVGMLLGGPNIQTQSDNVIETQAALTIAQTIKFNTTIRRRKNSTATYNSRNHECPLPMYIGLLVHAKTRKRGLIDKLNDVGLSISYNRVLELSTELGNKICQVYERQNIVCPINLRKGVFTTGAVDNIDHNPSSTTSHGSFHGTGISLFQHRQSISEGQAQDILTTEEPMSTPAGGLRQLPISYRCVLPVGIPAKQPNVPCALGPLRIVNDSIPAAVHAQYMWLEHVRGNVKIEHSPDVQLSWSAFHASLQSESAESKPTDISVLLPLFEEQAKSTAMIKHSMNIVADTVQLLNPGQTPVIACDQPLYTIAKHIQWNWPDTHGESKYVVMFWGLHIEMAALKALGSWLENSGWTHALEQANVASSGTADSFLKATHVSRTRHAHQVSACALYILMHQAFTASEEDADLSQFEPWQLRRESESPHFQFWSLTLRFQLAVLIFVKSLREGNFQLYMESLVNIVPWFFALDHPNYARWLPIHIRDMILLEKTNPTVAEQFQKGNFVVNKTSHVFSGLPIDQAHEQNNKLVKGDGGAVGLTENSTELLRWMVSGPEVAKVVKEFEASVESIKHTQSKGPNLRHHEQVKGVQKQFRKQVLDLCSTIQGMGNPFLEQSEDLMKLGTRDIVDENVVETVREIERIGTQQYNRFVVERLEAQDKLLTEPIKQNKLPLFSRQTPRKVSNVRKQIQSLKQNCSLFAKLYVSCQVREGNLDEFFAHENTSFPPALSQFGNLRSGTKSDLLGCLETIAPTQIQRPEVEALILDGAVTVNFLRPTGCITFADYAENIYKPYVENQLATVQRLDIVWDEYIPDSLKASTRSKRGKGVRRRVLPDSRIPGNWEGFLRVDENKSELFQYLADRSVEVAINGKQVNSTKGTDIVASHLDEHIDGLMPCTHEEADTRLLLHTSDAANKGHRRVMIRSVDTDVIVLAIGMFPELSLDELWVAFGTGKNLRYYSVHAIVQQIGASKAKALPAFHAFTGCDQTSSFAGRGKKTAWGTWASFEDATQAFELITTSPSLETLQIAMPLLERFVVLLYDRASTASNVNETRKLLFTRKGRSIEAIPPTAAALFEHTKRVIYQAGYCWGQALMPSPELPCPAEWGWQKGSTNRWEPCWSSLAQASVSCQELLKCNCKPDKGCRGKCKCVMAEMICTMLCQCGGDCDRG